jgi:hypothetical protein
MKLDELNRQIKSNIKIGDIVKCYFGSDVYYTRVVKTTADELSGWWYSKKEMCNELGNNQIGNTVKTSDCVLVK